jgi:ATP-dependent 26S proteasome regulatory subunit
MALCYKLRMTKYPENFDFASHPDSKKYTAGRTDIYVVDEMKMHEQLFDQQHLLEVDNSEYEDDFIKESRLTFFVTGDTDDNRRMIQTSSVRYEETARFDDKDYFDALNGMLPQHFSLEGNDFFHNHRFLSSLSDGMDLSISRNDALNSIIISNSNRARHETYSGRFLELEAPLLSDITVEMAGEHMNNIMQLHALSIDALSRIVRRRRVSEVFVFTPEGRFYTENDHAKAAKVPPEPIFEAADPSMQIDAAPEKPKGVTFNDIAGLESLKEKMRNVADSFLDSELMEAYGMERPQGVLLYGPPGTGKTTLARALANEIGGNLVSVDADEIYDKWLGNSEHRIADIFAEAEEYTEPTVLLFDEFDALFDNSDRATTSNVNVAGIFKKQSQALREKNPNVILFATTNYLDRIDSSLVRSGRFDIKEYVETPKQNDLMKIYDLKYFSAKDEAEKAGLDLFLDTEHYDLFELAKNSDGLTGADITEIFRRTKFAAFSRRARDKREGVTNTDKNAYKITQQQLLFAIQEIKNTLSR